MYSNIYSYYFPKIHRILPGWKKWTYCNGLQESDKLVWLTVKNIFLSKPNHELLPYLSYLVCGLHNFYNLEEFRIAFDNNNSSFDSIKFKSTTASARISITIFHLVVPRILHDSVSLDSAMMDLQDAKPK